VELKHCRLAMLASLGFLVGEQFHPLWGGSVDVPSYIAYQQTPLQTFWPIVIAGIAVVETFSVFTFQNPKEQAWAINTDHVAGDLGFDPLGLMPTNAADLKSMQDKELNNGRLAMFAIAGMVGQELANGAKLF
jgi:light-harvesting complex I chlorophyll a/b binding protein 4